MKGYLIPLLISLNVICHATLSGEYHIQPINNQDALPAKEINCIFQDSEGYIWFGTSDGLCRYDGYSVKIFKSSYQAPSLLQDNMVTSLAEDSNGLLWIGTLKGLNIYDRKTGEIISVDDPRLADLYIRVLHHTGKGQLWIGTDDGLFVYEEQSGTFHQFISDPTNPATVNGNKIRTLCEDNEGNIWAGFFDDGLCRITMETFEVVRYPNLGVRNRITAIFLDKDNNLWLGAWADGVYKVLNHEDPAMATYQRMDSTTRYERLIYTIMQDENGDILLGTGLGIDRITPPYTPDEYQPLKIRETTGSPNNEITGLCPDNNGIIWIATKRNGVYQLFKERNVFTNYEYESLDDLKQPASVNCFYEWGDDILIGIDKVGIARFNKNTEEICSSQYDKELGKIPFPMGHLRTIVKQPGTDRLYLGSEYGGLFICELGNDHIRSANQYLKPWSSDWLTGDIVQGICCDREGNVWISTNHGFNIITPAKDTLIYGIRELGKDILCQSIIEDDKGNIWIGTSHYGIIKIDKSKGVYQLIFQEYTFENQKNHINDVKCLYQNSRKQLFAGTKGGGLCSYNEESDRFVPVSGIESFSSHTIFSIVESEQYLYMGTNQGLLQFDPYGEENKQLIVFTKSDGLLDNTFNPNAVMKSENDNLYFGTPRGFVVFDPKQIEADIPTGNLVISDIRIFHNSYDNLPEKQRKRISPDYHPNYARRIILSHREYNFGIEFATLSYKHPDKNRYAYMLEGFDNDWNYVTATNRFAYYTNMKSGTYRFLVRGTNENSYMNPEPEALEIIVLPPPYKSWWAYLIYITLFFSVAFVVIRFLLYRTKMKMQDMEHRKNEELAQEKIKFFTNISHELLTPLTIISCSIEELQRKYNDRGNAWKAIRGNIFRLNRLLEQILDFRKAEKGRLKLAVSYGDAAKFITGLCRDNFLYYEQRKHIRFIYNTLPEHIPAWFDRNMIDMIMYNLISNAFKYNRTNGLVSVSVEAEEQMEEYAYRYLHIKIGNTGDGLSPRQMEELFRRFQSFSYVGREKQGNGIGLYLTKTLVELHKGTIEVSSTPGEWTEFRVRIPIYEEIYSNEVGKRVEDIEKSPGEEIPEIIDAIETIRTEHSTLLLIEDDTELLASIVRFLSENHTVLTAIDGQTGLQIAKEQNPDLIISDVMLPEMNGFDLCRQIKEDLSVSHIPIILLTAKVSTADKIYGLDSGADAYITKPFRFDILVAQIRNLLSNRQKLIARFREDEKMKLPEGERTSPDQQFLEKAIAIVEENIENIDFSVQEFQEAMVLSGSMLYRKLKALTGLSPNEFIRSIRLKKACVLLSEEQYNISEVAYKVGFNDPKYFSNCFKKEFGKTPSEYQKNIYRTLDL
ncbi:MAG: response regulator [Tannerellaceae bacterium]|jgi:ligand-binding sensor domain-containing protein/signal transduction histidine kinase/DNA-binding response OmpR family regulator|nr:response regulator [Tannerellaceae bacterium]